MSYDNRPHEDDLPNKSGFTKYRDNKKPMARHLAPDDEYSEHRPVIGTLATGRMEIFQKLPRPAPEDGTPLWNSLALFFNLSGSDLPPGYQTTAVQDARNFLDEGVDPADPTLSEWMRQYWQTLSYGNLVFGIDTPRDGSGMPLVPQVDAPDGDAEDWGGLIKACIEANPEAVWQAAGSLQINDGRRWIPSVFLVQNYSVGASATFYGDVYEIGDHEYVIGDVTHIAYDLSFFSGPGVPVDSVRNFWAILSHEFSHNFLEFWDLYGPAGCTGYWDLLGDNSPPWFPSEVCSVHKRRVGWCDYKRTYEGPQLRSRSLSLLPYTTSGEAYKIVPDPDFTPHEYFILEYRKSSSADPWTPDGALQEEGLFIVHINERMGVPGIWLLRDAPYFDPEFADYSDNGGSLWTGSDRLNGILFPQGDRNSFTRLTNPSSDLYGHRDSGLHITNIRMEEGCCKFRLEIDASPGAGWRLGNRDRFTAGRFSLEAEAGGQELFCRNDSSSTLLTHRQAQWLARGGQHGDIDGWVLGENDYELAADLDGDGLDELYIRNHHMAGLLKWQGTAFEAVTIQHDSIDAWGLGPLNWEFKADIDGDGRDEICIRAPQWIGVIKLTDNQLDLIAIQHGPIGGFPLEESDKEHTGRFTQTQRDEIIIVQPQQLGLFEWNEQWQQLDLKKHYAVNIGSWTFSATDRIAIGDFDGDGRDEIYLRADNRAGIIKWVAGDFQLIADTSGPLQPVVPDACPPLSFAANDQSYAGRFLPGRDGVLHRHDGGLAVLTFDNQGIRVRHCMSIPLGDHRWQLDPADKFVLGDFHRIGRDVADPVKDYIIDELTDVFIHNPSATAMIGINHGIWDSQNAWDIHSEIGLTWTQQEFVMHDSSLIASGCLPLARFFRRLFGSS